MCQQDLYSEFGQPSLIETFLDNEIHMQSYAHMVHKHKNQLELLYISRGQGRYHVGGRDYAMREGDLIVCNNEILHGQDPFQKIFMQTYCIALTGVQIKGLPANWMVDAQQKPMLTLPPQISQTIGQLMITVHENFQCEQKAVLLCQTLAMSIFLLVWQELQQQKMSGEQLASQKRESLVRQITEYLDQNYTSQITLQDISEALHISVSHLSHVFKRETGLSPVQYVVYRRIGEAQSMLSSTDLPIGEIEEQLGFGSSCHLSMMFKKYVGISPKEYRKRFQQKK